MVWKPRCPTGGGEANTRAQLNRIVLPDLTRICARCDGVWVGNDDNGPTRNVVGDMPARIWNEFVKEALPARARAAPIVQRRLNRAIPSPIQNFADPSHARSSKEPWRAGPSTHQPGA